MTASDELFDALTELIGLGIGKAAEVLNLMLDSHIALSAPVLRIIDINELASTLGGGEGRARELSAVRMRYSGSMSGSVELIFSAGEAIKLVDCLIGEESVTEEGLDSIRAGTLCEVGNIVINALLGTLSNQLSFVSTIPFPSTWRAIPAASSRKPGSPKRKSSCWRKPSSWSRRKASGEPSPYSSHLNPSNC